MKKKWLFFIILAFTLTLNGCGSKYSYYLYTKNAEDALKAGNHKKAKDLISYAYLEEKSLKDKNPERLTWLYYRLGVIAELSGNIFHAKGYYWGDQVEPGFYKNDLRIAWLAKTGWTRLDEGKPPRSFAEILELEEMEPPREEPKKVEKKKISKKQPKQIRSYTTYNSNEEVTRKDTPITYPADRNAKGLFKVSR